MIKKEERETVICDLCGKVARVQIFGEVTGRYYFLRIEEHGDSFAAGINIDKQICDKCYKKIEKVIR